MWQLHLDGNRMSFFKEQRRKRRKKRIEKRKNRRWKELQEFGLKTGRLERGNLKDNVFNN